MDDSAEAPFRRCYLDFTLKESNFNVGFVEQDVQSSTYARLALGTATVVAIPLKTSVFLESVMTVT